MGHDMWKDGFTNIDCIDYAQSVIDLMNSKYEKEVYSNLRFHCADMMDMHAFSDGTYDFVIDKATMDVILTGNKDPWNPTPEVYDKSLSTLSEAIRVLKTKATFISISFD